MTFIGLIRVNFYAAAEITESADARYVLVGIYCLIDFSEQLRNFSY
jgi:hypothetical protein